MLDFAWGFPKKIMLCLKGCLSNCMQFSLNLSQIIHISMLLQRHDVKYQHVETSFKINLRLFTIKTYRNHFNKNYS